MKHYNIETNLTTSILDNTIETNLTTSILDNNMERNRGHHQFKDVPNTWIFKSDILYEQVYAPL